MINRTRRALGFISRAVRSVTNPAALVLDQQPAEQPASTVETAPEPAGLYTDDEIPAVADIEAAALGYDLASDNARQADRAKRKHRKILDRLPTGTYGAWTVARKPSSRTTVDLDQVRAIFAAHGLGDVPMRTCAATLTVTRTEQPAGVVAA